MTDHKFNPGDVLIQSYWYPHGIEAGPSPERVFFDIKDRTGLYRPRWVRVTVVAGTEYHHDVLWYRTLLLKSNSTRPERAAEVDNGAIKLHDSAEIFGINIVKLLRQALLKMQLISIVEK